MPTYILTAPADRLSAPQKARIATEITRVHKEITGASSFFAQVIVNEVPAGNHFVGGKPLAGETFHLQGQIRAGRSAIDRARLLLALRDAVVGGAATEAASVWVYLLDIPPRDMIEYGHVLPEPGHEATWLAALPEADRARMQSVGL